MKAPDKIYCGNNGHGNLSYSTEKIYPSMDEYIRKDGILEWAKKRQCEQGFEDGEAEHGYQSAIQDLIKHIESL